MTRSSRHVIEAPDLEAPDREAPDREAPDREAPDLEAPVIGVASLAAELAGAFVGRERVDHVVELTVEHPVE
jgi:hypothetical protein